MLGTFCVFMDNWLHPFEDFFNVFVIEKEKRNVESGKDPTVK